MGCNQLDNPSYDTLIGHGNSRNLSIPAGFEVIDVEGKVVTLVY